MPEIESHLVQFGPLIDYVWESLKSGGWILMPIFLASVWGWVLCLLSMGNLRKLGLSGRKAEFFLHHGGAAVDAFLDSPAARKQRETLAVKCLQRLRSAPAHASVDELEELSQELLHHDVPQLEAGFSTIAMIGGLAPLLGLLGTVSGMITTFDVISNFGNSNPALMAGSLAEALVTTQNGLLVAFPIVIIHVFLVNAAARIERDAEALNAMYIEYRKEQSR